MAYTHNGRSNTKNTIPFQRLACSASSSSTSSYMSLRRRRRQHHSMRRRRLRRRPTNLPTSLNFSIVTPLETRKEKCGVAFFGRAGLLVHIPMAHVFSGSHVGKQNSGRSYWFVWRLGCVRVTRRDRRMWASGSTYWHDVLQSFLRTQEEEEVRAKIFSTYILICVFVYMYIQQPHFVDCRKHVVAAKWWGR